MSKPRINKALATATQDPHGWLVKVPVELGTLFGKQVGVHFETRLLPAKKTPPAISAAERKLAVMLLSKLPDLLADVERRFDKYFKKKAVKFRETIRDPHIYISRDIQEDEGPEHWTFVIGFEDSEDYALDLEFEGMNCIDVAGGD